MTVVLILVMVALSSLTSEVVNNPKVNSFNALVLPTPSNPEVLYTSMFVEPALPIFVTGTASPCKERGT